MSATAARSLVLVGAGGHARVIAALARALGREVVAARDKDPDKQGTSLGGVPVVAPGQGPSSGVEIVIALGKNRSRARAAATVDHIAGPLVHPHSWVAPDAEIGAGTVVFAGAVIQPGARVGEHVIVNTGATVDHDCVLGSFCHLAPGVHLAGQVEVGEGAFLGVGAAVVNGVRIGEWARLGAGAVAIRDVPPRVTAVGVPARVVDDER